MREAIKLEKMFVFSSKYFSISIILFYVRYKYKEVLQNIRRKQKLNISFYNTLSKKKKIL